MFVVVAYDIASDRRRNKVAKILAGYGERVNLSVFECEFKKPETLVALKGKLKEVIKPKKDHIRYYTICMECRAKIAIQGYGAVEEKQVVKFA